MKSIVVFIMISFFLGACSDPKTYPAEVRDNFVNACCKKNEDLRPMCNCMFDKIKDKYTYKEYVDLEQKMKAGETPQEFLDFTNEATAACTEQTSN